MDLSKVPLDQLQEELGLRLCDHQPTTHVSLRDVPKERIPLITCKCGKKTWVNAEVEFGQLGLPITMKITHAQMGGIRIECITEDGVPYRVYGIPRKGDLTINDGLYVKLGVELPDSTRW